MLGEGGKARLGLGELAAFVEEHTQVKRGPDHVIGDRAANKSFQAFAFGRVVFEFGWIPQQFLGGLLVLGVIVERAFIVESCFGPFLGLVVRPGQQITGMGAEVRVAERSQHAQGFLRRRVIVKQEAGEAVIISAQVAVFAFDQDRIAQKSGRVRLGFFDFADAQLHLGLIAARSSGPFHVGRVILRPCRECRQC